MEFATTENQTMITQAVRDLCEKELRPHVMEWDEEQHLPIDLFKQHFGPAGMLEQDDLEVWARLGSNLASMPASSAPWPGSTLRPPDDAADELRLLEVGERRGPPFRERRARTHEIGPVVGAQY